MDDEADPQERPSPSSSAICDIAPDDGDEAINAAIADCRDGSTVRFPKDKTYRQDGPIRIDDRHNLTIDGNGSTFITNSSSPSAGMGNFTILRGTNITFQKVVGRGAFNLRPIDGKYSLGQYPASGGGPTRPSASSVPRAVASETAKFTMYGATES